MDRERTGVFQGTNATMVFCTTHGIIRSGECQILCSFHSFFFVWLFRIHVIFPPGILDSVNAMLSEEGERKKINKRLETAEIKWVSFLRFQSDENKQTKKFQGLHWKQEKKSRWMVQGWGKLWRIIQPYFQRKNSRECARCGRSNFFFFSWCVEEISLTEREP